LLLGTALVHRGHCHRDPGQEDFDGMR
jgi:hypothetical protein